MKEAPLFEDDEKKVFCMFQVMMPISEIVKRRNPKNRNKHSKNQIKQLAKQMKVNGVRHPIVISTLSDVLNKGHGRLEAALYNSWTTYPVVYEHYESADQEYQVAQSDNALALQAELDLSGINLDLQDLGPFDIDLLGIKDFVVEPMDKYNSDEDEVPEVKDAICKRGDLWILGNHRLLCGDATDAASVALLMNGEKADMVYTDPPYGMNLDAEAFGHKNVHGDDVQFDPKPLLKFFDSVEDVFIYGADYFVELLGRKWPNLGSWIIWDKCKELGVETDWSGRQGSEFETLWSKKKYQRKVIRALPRIGFFAKKDEQRVHPTQKPVRLHELFFEQYGKDKTNIVDLYGGSGSTLIACEKTNRRCFGMEIDPHYCDVIIARWEKFAGKKAHKENGEVFGAA